MGHSRIRIDVPRIVDLYRQKRLKLDELISGRYQLSEINEAIEAYGAIPSLSGITSEALMARLVSDKKTIGGRVHFVLPTRIGETVIRSNVPDDAIRAAIEASL